jgi:phage terminase large subunit-like protein
MGKATVHVLAQIVELTSMLTKRQKPKTKKVSHAVFARNKFHCEGQTRTQSSRRIAASVKQLTRGIQIQ